MYALLAAAPPSGQPGPSADSLTFLLSVVAIALAVSAIVFAAVFFAIQRHEARMLTRSVQDLVAQAIREEKGIDQLSDQMMPLIDRLVQAQVSVDRAQSGPEVEKLVRELLKPVENSLSEMEQRVDEAAQSDGVRQEMDSKVEALRQQIAEVAREAGHRTAARRRPVLRTGLTKISGETAQQILRMVLFAHRAGGTAVEDDVIDQFGASHASLQVDAAELGLIELDSTGFALTPGGRRVAEHFHSDEEIGDVMALSGDVARSWVEVRGPNAIFHAQVR